MCVLVAQSCPTFCDSMDYSPPGSSVHGILQERILEWVAISLARGSSRPRNRTQVSCIAGRCFTLWAAREASYFPSSTIHVLNCMCASVCVSMRWNHTCIFKYLNHRTQNYRYHKSPLCFSFIATHEHRQRTYPT